MGKPRRKIARTTSELAKVCEVSVQTVRRWVRDGCPRNGDGSFDVEKILTWRADMHLRKKDRSVGAEISEPDTGGKGSAMLTAKLAKEEAVAELKRIELETLLGDRIPRSEVAGLLVERAALLKRLLLKQSPAKVAEEFPVKLRTKVQRAVRAEMTRVLEELAYEGKADNYRGGDDGGRKGAA